MDDGEAYELALRHAAERLDWRGSHRSLVLIGDDRPHGVDYPGNNGRVDWRHEVSNVLVGRLGVVVHAVQVFRADADACVFAWAVEEVTLLAAPSSSNVFVRAAGRYLHLSQASAIEESAALGATPRAAPLVVVRAPSSAKRKRPYAFGDLLAADPRLVDLIELGTAADVCDAVLDAGLK